MKKTLNFCLLSLSSKPASLMAFSACDMRLHSRLGLNFSEK
ncbi:hypothetical protein [Campylobacter sp. 19-13652]|nr:hypothetical protein [Campylobacter sp. 19-13652]